MMMHVDFQSSMAAYWIKYSENGERVIIVFSEGLSDLD